MGTRLGPYPPFSWSESKDRLLRNCPRAYALKTYTAWNGWLPGAPEAARRAWTLSKLITLPQAVGETIHRLARLCVRRAVGRLPLPSMDELHRRGRTALNDLVHCSRTHQQEFAHRPNAVPMLAEIFYDGTLSGEAIARAKASLSACLIALARCEILDELRECDPAAVRPVEALECFTIEGIVVYGAPDVAYVTHLDNAPLWNIVDWKTGRFDGVVDQLAVYALLLRHGLLFGPHPTLGYRATVAALGVGGAITHVALSAADLEDARHRILKSADVMRAYLIDRAANRPASLEVFQPRPGRRCRDCVFRGMCPDAASPT
jgi:hypothetical protein